MEKKKTCATCQHSGIWGNRLVCWLSSDDEICTVSEDYNCEDYDEKKDKKEPPTLAKLPKKQKRQGMSASLKKAQQNYSKKCKMLQVRLNKETEADLIEWVERGQAATRIKELIREDIRKNPVK